MVEKSEKLNKTMNTSKKLEVFLNEPMGNKLATELPGIGKVLGERLSNHGFDFAYTLLGQYLLLKKDETLFNEWLHSICEANAKQCRDCFNCLDEYANSCI